MPFQKTALGESCSVGAQIALLNLSPKGKLYCEALLSHPCPSQSLDLCFMYLVPPSLIDFSLNTFEDSSEIHCSIYQIQRSNRRVLISVSAASTHSLAS
jgi:hypothetical protein